MKLISVNVGSPREIVVGGKTVKTSIWKNSVQGRVHVSTLNLDGDQQSDLSVHGESIKPSTFTRANIIPIGELSYLMPTCVGERSAKTSPVKGILEDRIKSATAFGLAQPSSW
jgi:hypothetical protein